MDSPIWSCSKWGLPCHRCYQQRGALLPHHFTLTDPALHRGLRRYIFCGTFRRLAPPRRYLALTIRDTEREVLNYNQALEWLQKKVLAGEFSPSAEMFSHLQGMVVAGLMDNPVDIGAIRQRPVVIRDPRSPGDTVFMPPDHRDVPNLLNDLMNFVQANLQEIDPVILAGLFHKQAVIIHPYMDGNGRSTRLMSTALLGLSGLDLFTIFSF